LSNEIGVCAGDPVDETMETESAKIVRHTGRGVNGEVLAEKRGDGFAEHTMGKTLAKEGDVTQSGEKGHDAGLA